MIRRRLSDNVPGSVALGTAPVVTPSAAAASDVPTPGRFDALRPARWWPEMAALARANQHWALFLLPYAAAWWQPVYWCTHEDHFWDGRIHPLAFQPLIFLGVAALAWQDRRLYAERFAQQRRMSGERGGRRRLGSPLLLALGCLVMLAGQVVHLASLAILGLLLLAAGALLRLYGPAMMRLFARPLLFSLLLIPPPASPLGKVDDVTLKISARLGAALLRLAGRGTGASGMTIQFPDHTFTLARFYGGFNVALYVAVSLLFVAVWRRMRLGPAVMLMAVGAVVGVLCNLPRLMVAAMVSGSNEAMAARIMTANAWLVAVPALVVVLLLERASRPAQAWLAARFRGARALGVTAERATNRVTGRAAERLGGVTRAAGSSTDMIERGFKALDKLFKGKKRRGGRRRW
jgi:hypothetical protein